MRSFTGSYFTGGKNFNRSHTIYSEFSLSCITIFIQQIKVSKGLLPAVESKLSESQLDECFSIFNDKLKNSVNYKVQTHEYVRC